MAGSRGKAQADRAPGLAGDGQKGTDMRMTFGLAATALMLSFGAAQAQSNDERVTRSLTDQGFTDIEISRDDGQMEVEAWRGDQKVEITYDLATGEVVKSESETISGGKRADDRADAADDRNDPRDRDDDGDDDRDGSDDRDSDDRDDGDDRDDSANDRDDDSDDGSDDDNDGRDGDDNDDNDSDDDSDDDGDDD